MAMTVEYRRRANPKFCQCRISSALTPLDTPNPFSHLFGTDPLPTLTMLAVIARLHLSTLTGEQAETAMKPLLTPLPRRHRRVMQRSNRVSSSVRTVLRLLCITQWTFMLHANVPTFNIAAADNENHLKYLSWNSFQQEIFQTGRRPKRCLCTSWTSSKRMSERDKAMLSTSARTKSAPGWPASPAAPPAPTTRRSGNCRPWPIKSL